MYYFILAADRAGVNNLMGVKFTNEILMDFVAVGNYKNKKYQMLMGRDEQLTAALASGVCDADVSSTTNFMSFNLPLATLYNKYTKEDQEQAQALQLKTVEVIEQWGILLPGYN